MRYVFHGHESSLELKDVVTFEPELAARLARRMKEPEVEEAVAVLIDIYGGKYVREQAAHIEVIGRRWAQLATQMREAGVSSDDDKERIRSIPERLCFRLDAVWGEGRAAVFLTLRAAALRVGCDIRDAALHVDGESVSALMDLVVDGLRRGFAASVDAALAVSLLEHTINKPRAEPTSSTPATLTPASVDIDWAAEVTDAARRMAIVTAT